MTPGTVITYTCPVCRQSCRDANAVAHCMNPTCNATASEMFLALWRESVILREEIRTLRDQRTELARKLRALGIEVYLA